MYEENAFHYFNVGSKSRIIGSGVFTRSNRFISRGFSNYLACLLGVESQMLRRRMADGVMTLFQPKSATRTADFDDATTLF